MEGLLLIKTPLLIGSISKTRYCVLDPDTGVLTHYSGTSTSGASKEVARERLAAAAGDDHLS